MAGVLAEVDVIGKLRVVETKVSEWNERELKSSSLQARLRQHRKKLQSIERRLAELGTTVKPTSSKNSEAIRATGLPELRSPTWSAWVKLNSIRPNLDAIISANYSAASQGHSLGFHSGRVAYHPRVVWNHGKGSHRIISSSQPVEVGRWHHLAATFDSKSAKLKLYVNGQLAAQAEGVESTPFSVVAVGRREAPQQFGFRGDVDDVRVYREALTDTEIAKLANGDSVVRELVLHWDFDRSDADRIQDASGHQFDGVPIGFFDWKTRFVRGRKGNAFSFQPRSDKSRLNKQELQEVERLRTEWKQLSDSTPETPRVMAVATNNPSDMPILVRGNHLSPGDTTVTRTTPAIFKQTLPSPSIPAKQNGRLQLARWMTDPRHPLTARVMVNRIWQGHFGTGLVRTPSNFGRRGNRPSHPRLLDWLASELIASDWSIKHTHRLIVTSNSYRLGNLNNHEAIQRDPSARLLWRHNVRRLDVEAIRDSLLHVGGNLNLQMGGSIVDLPNLKRVKLEPNAEIYDVPRRTTYLPVIRIRGYEMFSVFDLPTSGEHVATRPTTVVPQQALFMLNNPLVLRQVEKLANRVVTLHPCSDEQRVSRLYLILYGRPVDQSELDWSKRQLERFRKIVPLSVESNVSEDELAWRAFCHVLVAANEFIFMK